MYIVWLSNLRLILRNNIENINIEIGSVLCLDIRLSKGIIIYLLKHNYNKFIIHG